MSGDDENTDEAATLAELNDRLAASEMQLMETAKLATVGELAASLAHEVSQPLTHIRGVLQLVTSSVQANKPINERLLGNIIEASRQTERVGVLIQDLLRFVRKDRTQPMLVSVSDVFRHTHRLLRGLLRQHNVQLTTGFTADCGVWATASQLEQVFINLTQNAVAAFADLPPEETREISVTTLVDQENPDQMLICVRDNGPGMSAGIRERIFEPFFTTKPAGKGTGLGLSILKRIVTEHGGSIDCESKPGEGTVFFVRLRRYLPDSHRGDCG